MRLDLERLADHIIAEEPAMTPYSTPGGLNPDFNTFLQAPIHEDSDGMPVSVVSALARLDLDPWQEAAHLSALSRGKATERLATLIAGLPDSASIGRNPVRLAASLVALLPRNVREVARPKDASMDSPASIKAGRVATVVLFLLILAAIIASQYFGDDKPPVALEKGPVAPTAAVPAPAAAAEIKS